MGQRGSGTGFSQLAAPAQPARLAVRNEVGARFQRRTRRRQNRHAAFAARALETLCKIRPRRVVSTAPSDPPGRGPDSSLQSKRYASKEMAEIRELRATLCKPAYAFAAFPTRSSTGSATHRTAACDPHRIASGRPPLGGRLHAETERLVAHIDAALDAC